MIVVSSDAAFNTRDSVTYWSCSTVIHGVETFYSGVKYSLTNSGEAELHAFYDIVRKLCETTTDHIVVSTDSQCVVTQFKHLRKKHNKGHEVEYGKIKRHMWRWVKKISNLAKLPQVTIRHASRMSPEIQKHHEIVHAMAQQRYAGLYMPKVPEN